MALSTSVDMAVDPGANRLPTWSFSPCGPSADPAGGGSHQADPRGAVDNFIGPQGGSAVSSTTDASDVAGATTETVEEAPEAIGDVWHRASSRLRDELAEGNYSAWFGRAKPVGLDGHTF